MITEAVRPGPSEYGERTPDLLVGYARGYRSSDESAEGGVSGEEVIEPNRDKWSGDHCIDHRLVPGILVTNQRITSDSPSLADLTVAVLDEFGIAPPDGLIGKDVLQPPN